MLSLVKIRVVFLLLLEWHVRESAPLRALLSIFNEVSFTYFHTHSMGILTTARELTLTLLCNPIVAPWPWTCPGHQPLHSKSFMTSLLPLEKKTWAKIHWRNVLFYGQSSGKY